MLATALIALCTITQAEVAQADVPEVATSSSSTTGAIRRYVGPAVAIFPSYTPELVRGLLPISEARRRAFGAELGVAASEVLDWRRWFVIPDADLAEAIAEGTINGECQDDLCFAEIGVRAGATHALISSLVAPRPNTCRVNVTLYDLLGAEVISEVERAVAPCSDDNLLSTASDIGRTIVDGPRAPVRVTLNLTPRTLPTVDIPDVPDVPRYIVDTSSRTDRVFELERALQIYEEQHMYVFDSDDGETFYIARGGRLLSECDARRVASAPRTPEITEFCDGNDWEWAWLGVPFGGVVMLGSYGNFLDGGFVGVIGMGIGGILTVTSAALAIALNVDKKDPRDGTYYSSRKQIEAIVKDSNAGLRKQLDLTEAEVLVGGMRL
ncbi:MAG: hypothetical protein RIT81_34140 [Deltaproteobacteria bacterium]